MTEFTVTNQTLSEIRNFLVNRPYREVADIVQKLDAEIVPQLNKKEEESGSSDKKVKKAS
jgi:hypothetical protein